jgi:hypothetical protein
VSETKDSGEPGVPFAAPTTINVFLTPFLYYCGLRLESARAKKEKEQEDTENIREKRKKNCIPPRFLFFGKPSARENEGKVRRQKKRRRTEAKISTVTANDKL